MTPPNTEPRHVWLPHWAQIMLVAASALMILLPSADMLLHFDPTPPPQENRHLATLPELDGTLLTLQKWPSQFEDWARDHFGLRSSLIHAHSVLLQDVIGVAARQDVVIGKDGWLFLGTNKALDLYRCLFPYQPQGLAYDLGTLRQRAEYLAERHIAYINAWAPLKANVYPEFLPEWIHKTGGPCRLDQVAAETKRLNLPFTDLRPAEQRARQAGLAYHKTDTHWNPRGAYFAYQQLTQEIQKKFPQFQPPAPERVRFVEEQRPGGDLARMLDLAVRYAGPEVQLALEKRCHPVPPSVTRPAGVKLEAYDCPGGGLRILMLHDSFGNALIPFFAESAGHLLSVEFGGFDKEIIENEKPDVLIEVHVERQLQPDR